MLSPYERYLQERQQQNVPAVQNISEKKPGVVEKVKSFFGNILGNKPAPVTQPVQQPKSPYLRYQEDRGYVKPNLQTTDYNQTAVSSPSVTKKLTGDFFTTLRKNNEKVKLDFNAIQYFPESLLQTVGLYESVKNFLETEMDIEKTPDITFKQFREAIPEATKTVFKAMPMAFVDAVNSFTSGMAGAPFRLAKGVFDTIDPSGKLAEQYIPEKLDTPLISVLKLTGHDDWIPYLPQQLQKPISIGNSAAGVMRDCLNKGGDNLTCFSFSFFPALLDLAITADLVQSGLKDISGYKPPTDAQFNKAKEVLDLPKSYSKYDLQTDLENLGNRERTNVLRQSYHNQAHKFHPDLPIPTANAEMFNEVNQAWKNITKFPPPAEGFSLKKVAYELTKERPLWEKEAQNIISEQAITKETKLLEAPKERVSTPKDFANQQQLDFFKRDMPKQLEREFNQVSGSIERTTITPDMSLQEGLDAIKENANTVLTRNVTPASREAFEKTFEDLTKYAQWMEKNTDATTQQILDNLKRELSAHYNIRVTGKPNITQVFETIDLSAAKNVDEAADIVNKRLEEVYGKVPPLEATVNGFRDSAKSMFSVEELRDAGKIPVTTGAEAQTLEATSHKNLVETYPNQNFVSVQEAEKSLLDQGAKSIGELPATQAEFVLAKIAEGQVLPSALNNIAVKMYEQGVLRKVAEGTGTKIDVSGTAFATGTSGEPTVIDVGLNPDNISREDLVQNYNFNELSKTQDWKNLQEGFGTGMEAFKKGDIVVVSLPKTTAVKTEITTPSVGELVNVFDNGQAVIKTASGYGVVDLGLITKADLARLTPAQRVQVEKIGYGGKVEPGVSKKVTRGTPIEILREEIMRIGSAPLERVIRQYEATGSAVIATGSGGMRLVIKDEGEFVKVGLDTGKLTKTDIKLPSKTFTTKKEAFDFIRQTVKEIKKPGEITAKEKEAELIKLLETKMLEGDEAYIKKFQERANANPQLRSVLADAIAQARVNVEKIRSRMDLEKKVEEKVAEKKAEKPTPKVGVIGKQEVSPKANLFVQKVALKNKNLPILQEIKVKDGKMQATDLTIGIELNTDLKDGMYKVIGKDLVPTTTKSEDFPILPEVEGDKIGTVKIDDYFNKALKEASLSLGGEMRREISGVLIEIKNNKMGITSTDAARLYHKTILLKGENANTSFILDSPKKLSQVLQAIGSIAEIYEDKETVHFVGKYGSVSVRKIEGEYPKFEDIFPALKTQYEINRKDLLVVAKELKPYTDRTSAVKMIYKDGKFLLSAENKEQNIKKGLSLTATKREGTEIAPGSVNDGVLVMEIRADSPKAAGEYLINVNFLTDALSVSEESSIFFYPAQSKTLEAVFITDQRTLESKPVTQKEKVAEAVKEVPKSIKEKGLENLKIGVSKFENVDDFLNAVQENSAFNKAIEIDFPISEMTNIYGEKITKPPVKIQPNIDYGDEPVELTPDEKGKFFALTDGAHRVSKAMFNGEKIIKSLVEFPKSIQTESELIDFYRQSVGGKAIKEQGIRRTVEARLPQNLAAEAKATAPEIQLIDSTPEEIQKSGVAKETADYVEDGGELIKVNGETVGWIQVDSEGVMRALEIKPEFRNKGIATEVVKQEFGNEKFKARDLTENGREFLESIGKVNDLGDGEFEVIPEAVKPRIEEVTKKVKASEEFKVGDVIDQGERYGNGVNPFTIRKIEGNSVYFTDAEGTDFQGFSRSTLRNLIKEGAWKRVEAETGLEALKPEGTAGGNLAFNPKNLEEIDSPAASKEVDKIIKRSEISKKLAESLGYPVRRGKFRMQALGIYKPQQQLVRIKKGGLPVEFHEGAGHYLDDQLKLSDLINIEERKALMEEYAFKYENQPKRQRQEAFAEFMRFMLTGQEERARTLAPTFYSQYNEIMEGMPEVKEILDTARDDYARWKAMPSAAKVLSQISLEPEGKGSLADRLSNNAHNLYTLALDDLHPLSEFTALGEKKLGRQLPAETNPYILARNLRGWVGKANTFLEKGTFGKDYWEMVDGKAVPKFVGKSFSEIIKPISDAKKLNDFRVYLVSQRALELSGRNITTGISMADAKAALIETGKNNPEFKKTSEELLEYQNQLLIYAQENGLIGADVLAKIKELNKLRVPFYRVMEAERTGYMGGKKIAGNLTVPIKKIKGSEREIIDPLESIVKDTYAIINAAERNNIGIAMAKLAGKDFELGRLFEEVDRPMRPVSVNVVEVLQKALKGSGITTDDIPEELGEAMVTLFRPTQDRGANMLNVNFGADQKVFQVDPDLFRAIQGLNSEDVGAIMRIIALPAKWLRAGATLTPDFAVRNPVRDQFTAYVYSKYGFKPGIDLARGISEIFKAGDVYDLWRMSGGEHSMFVSLDRENLQKSFQQLVQTKGESALNIIKHPIQTLRVLSEYGEMGTRLGEMKRGLNAGATPQEAAFASREVTLDFARIGAKTKALNSIIAFWNPNVQGMDKMVRDFKSNPKRTLFRTLMGITLPSILLYLANRDDPRWKEIPQWQKDLFWIIMTKDHIYRIPKPFELGTLFGSVPERILEFADTNDPTLFDNLADSISNGASPGFIPTFLEPIIENITNYSFFLQRPIVPQGKESLPPEGQVGTYTSETAKIIGELLNYSPAKVDNLLQGYTGGLGRYAISALDNILKGTGVVSTPVSPAQGLEDFPILKSFMIRPPGGTGSQSVNKVYDLYSKITGESDYVSKLIKEGRSDEAKAYVQDHPEIVYSKVLRSTINNFSKMNQARDAIRYSKTLTAEQKKQKIDEIDALQLSTAVKLLDYINQNEE